ncbi:hypothetical protein GGR57DRAFT_472091 [Xylariaceae sp. FL1272]|nr:hypothetical protein GGR57DRAFT_472091 [Xylariaceae sp. FL1272]
MAKIDTFEDEELGVVVDKTEALALHSKRTERSRRKQQRKAKKEKDSGDLLGLPYELLMEILSLLRPSDLFVLQRTSKSFYNFLSQQQTSLGRSIKSYRYSCLERCFRLPVLIADIEPAIHHVLQRPERQETLAVHKKPYQHIKPPDPELVCTCLTCMLRWAALCLILDFAHWQGHLDKGEPIPIIPRGRFPQWNQDLLDTHASRVRKALHSPLWHARLLEAHLNSTTRSIARHAANKGNKRPRFRMTLEDVRSETDVFLERSGPASPDIPFHRDNYYLLECYMPNRGWSQQRMRWNYLPAEQHDADIKAVVIWERRRIAALEEEERKAAMHQGIIEPSIQT